MTYYPKAAVSVHSHAPGQAWSSSKTYAADDFAVGSDGNLYISGTSSNTNNDPTGGAGTTDVAHQSGGGVNTNAGTWTFQVTTICVVQSIDVPLYSGSGTWAPSLTDGTTTVTAPSTTAGSRATFASPITLVPGTTYTLTLNISGVNVQCSNTPSFSNITSMSNQGGYYLDFTLRGTTGSAAPWYKVYDPSSAYATLIHNHVKGLWSSAITYAADDLVYGSDNNLYSSNSASNINNNPTAAPGTAGGQSAGGNFISGSGTNSITFQVTQTLTVTGINVGLFNGGGSATYTLSGSDIATVTATGAVGSDASFTNTVTLHTGITYTLSVTAGAYNLNGNTTASYTNVSNESTISSGGAQFLQFTLKGTAGIAPWAKVLDTTAYLSSATAASTYQTIASSTVVTANRQTASYTLVLTDAGKCVEMNSASANNLTVPPNSSVAFPVGTVIEVFQYGAGLTSIVAGAGVTIRSYSSHLNLGGQYTGASLRKIATDEWALVGSLA